MLVEPVRPDAMGRAPHAQALLQVARTGAPPRSLDRVTELAAGAGWTLLDSADLGWEVEAIRLRPTDSAD